MANRRRYLHPQSAARYGLPYCPMTVADVLLRDGPSRAFREQPRRERRAAARRIQPQGVAWAEFWRSLL